MRRRFDSMTVPAGPLAFHPLQHREVTIANKRTNLLVLRPLNLAAVPGAERHLSFALGITIYSHPTARQMRLGDLIEIRRSDIMPCSCRSIAWEG